nr:L-serine ammonia-lyase [Zooshikella ganghwensis]
MMFSVLDLFKVGIGPSSSHTVGPMLAAYQFIGKLAKQGKLSQVTSLRVELYGSLALTGKGHGTDQAVVLGLLGHKPDTVPTEIITELLANVADKQKLDLPGGPSVPWFSRSITFIPEALPKHENGMCFIAKTAQGQDLKEIYYSIGGGYVVTDEEFSRDASPTEQELPYKFSSAEELLHQCDNHGLSLSRVIYLNELMFYEKSAIVAKLKVIWNVMQQAIARGIETEGYLPGPIKVPRRAAALHRYLSANNALSVDPMTILDWVNMFALAVSEENAAGGRIVTAPTNGAAGILPAVLAYYDKFVHPVGDLELNAYFMVAGGIGLLYKMNASISGAEVGCQGEVGVACSMAAAGLTEIMGGSPQQVAVAAEIGMEHNLGLTCDPVAGQVQVPCIERNALAAVKAINASRMALRRSSSPTVSLDKVIETMYETGKDMHSKYRETSQGGLAVKIIARC